MTPAEEKVMKQLREQGYSVIHQGCPDFLCFKVKNKNASRKEDIDKDSIMFIEVKYNGDILKHEQIIWKDVLELLGLNYKLIHISPEKSGVS